MPGQELEAGMETGMEAESTANFCILACSLAHIQRSSYTAMAHVLRDGNTHSEMGLPIKISNQENVPKRHDHRPIWRKAIPQLISSLPKFTSKISHRKYYLYLIVLICTTYWLIYTATCCNKYLPSKRRWEIFKANTLRVYRILKWFDYHWVKKKYWWKT